MATLMYSLFCIEIAYFEPNFDTLGHIGVNTPVGTSLAQNMPIDQCILTVMQNFNVLGDLYARRRQETQLSLTNRSTRLEVSQGHKTWYHSIC